MVTFGIIGAGGIANKLHFPQLDALPGASVKAIAGRKEARLRILADRWRVPTWTQDWHDILEDPSIDAVVVALPHPLHVPAGIAVLEAGKHLLMQKPLCDSMEDAHRFVAAADAAASRGLVTLAMPHFAPAIYAARDQLARGTIGRVSGASGRSSHGGPEVYYAEVRDAFEEEGDDLWFFDASRASVGALFDMGVYATSQLIAVGGSVARVTGRTSTFDKPTQLEDTATLLLEFESGALGTMETGWCDPARTNFLHVHGTRGKLQAPGHQGNPLSHWTPGSYTREDIPATPVAVAVEPFAKGNVHEHFVACIEAGVQPPVSNARFACHVTEVLLAGLASAKSGGSVVIGTRVG